MISSRWVSVSILIFLLNGASPARADVTAAERGQIQAWMHAFEAELAKLRPYLVSDDSFQDANARKRIGEALTSLEKQASSGTPKGIEANPGFRVTYDLMAQHLRHTRKAFDDGKYGYARLRLNATTNFCASCHAQMPERKNEFVGEWGEMADLKAATLVNAEYLFITRRFDQALAKFDVLIRTYPASGLKAEQVMAVYGRKLAIFSRVKRDPGAAIANLRADLKNGKLPKDARASIEVWISVFERWKKKNKVDPSKLPTEKLIAFVKENAPGDKFRKLMPSDPDVVTYLHLSGLLYERLLSESEARFSQEILYYLAGLERPLAPLHWYSLSDSYWRECITKYPKMAYTKRCYEAYETELRERYPAQGKSAEDVRIQLERLKSYL